MAIKIKDISCLKILFGIIILFTFCELTSAQTSQFTEREVSFQSDSTELSGTLLLADTENSSPAIVFLHGSGPHKRDGFRPYAEEFAKLGISSLFFDKRGSGASNGSWLTSSLDDLAGDALAAVEFLKKQEEIDAERIGFWGISQAGWVATRAAAQSRDIAFMIIISGGGANPEESEYFSYKKMFNQAGLSKEMKSRAFSIIDRYFHYLATGEGRAQLVDTLDSLESSPDDPLHQLPQVVKLPSPENRPNWSWVATYKTTPDIGKIRGPILLMFGELDDQHPTELAVQRWQEGLNEARNKRTTIMVFPKAGHGIRLRKEHSGNGRAPFADGYEEIQLGWLWQHVISKK